MHNYYLIILLICKIKGAVRSRKKLSNHFHFYEKDKYSLDKCNNCSCEPRPYRLNIWNKSSRSCRWISTDVTGRPSKFIDKYMRYIFKTFLRQMPVMYRRRCIWVMSGICVGICVQTRTHTVKPPLDTVIEILSSLDHF